MFSTIRSYLLGGSAPAPEEPNAEVPEAASSSSSSVHESSSLLELTLNAATSKITEQLLPPSASIEQLQSSSHQLLPTLNEQHQEDELKKLRRESGNSNSVEATDEDSELFNDDSWELLDLELPGDLAKNLTKDESSNSTVQDVMCVNMSTLLDRHGESVENTAEPIVVVRNQKQLKVSFKMPDLVTEQELELDHVDSAIIATKPATKKNNKQKKNKHTTGPASAKVKGASKVIEAQPSESKQALILTASSKKPILNYAQVLKPKFEASSSLQKKESEAKCDAAKPSTLKRNRTISTTSWSSDGDESDLVATHWDDDVENDTLIFDKPHQTDDQPKSVLELKQEVNELDNNIAINESMISSTFSDFDCKYQEMNDFVLKPKKRRNKKQKRLSSTSLVPVSRRLNPIETTKKITDENETDEPTTSTDNGKKSNLLKLKPKKRNVIGENHINSPVEFVKALDVPKSDRKAKKNSSSERKIGVSPSPVSSSFGCTDSSDGPDMDESWFVTPPPCFTNADKTKGFQSKLKQAHRENELIEHPSVYFSNSGLKDSCARVEVNNEKKKSINENVSEDSAKATLIGLKNAQRMCNKSNSSCVKLEFKKSSTQKTTLEANIKKKSTVSRGNKFIVTNWAFDEQDDIDDFENMFEDESSYEESPKISLTKKSNKKKNKLLNRKIDSDCPVVSMNNSDELDSLTDSSPVPVEIDEIALMNELGESINDDDNSIEVVNEQLATNENIQNEVVAIPVRRSRATSGEKKAPIPVQPIEPERRPGWQLKRRRRFTSSSIPLNQGTVKTIKDKHAYADSGSSSTSARSSPSIIDRIGSTIVANLTNLTGDFSSSSGLPMQSRAPMQELDKLNNCAAKKSNSELEMVNRKRLSRSYLNRQNGCAKHANSKRRESRGLKMHKTFNGYSVDRKVQTNFPKSQ